MLRISTNPHRTSYQFVLQHRSKNDDRHGSESYHAHTRPVRLLLIRCSWYDTAKASIRYSKDQMQRELLENMYRADELDDLLKESDYTIRRRKECQQMVESLSKASEIVSQVQ